MTVVAKSLENAVNRFNELVMKDGLSNDLSDQICKDHNFMDLVGFRNTGIADIIISVVAFIDEDNRPEIGLKAEIETTDDSLLRLYGDDDDIVKGMEESISDHFVDFLSDADKTGQYQPEIDLLNKVFHETVGKDIGLDESESEDAFFDHLFYTVIEEMPDDELPPIRL